MLAGEDQPLLVRRNALFVLQPEANLSKSAVMFVPCTLWVYIRTNSPVPGDDDLGNGVAMVEHRAVVDLIAGQEGR